jgi:glycosyltransferase involved in cell wall biosynthesis
MKILVRQFLSKNHSWAIVGQNIARALIKLGHDIHLFSTNGLQYFPQDLKPNLIGYTEENQQQIIGRIPDTKYDCQISYTAMKNFPHYLSNGNSNRFGIWVYEWGYLPQGFAKHYKSTDYILAPSQFGKECFINSKVPEEKIKVIPHGIDLKQFENKNKYQLKTKKRVKILVNVGQSHIRKNIKGMFQAYHMAFTKNDDVCLVAKISKNEMKNPFDIDPIKTYNMVKTGYKNPPEVELITEYIPSIVELYNACDAVYSLSYSEGFGMTMTEAIGANKINICCRYGGQLDFLNDNNSILIDGKITKASLQEQYWGADPRNTHFDADLKDAANKLRFVYENLGALNNKILPTYDLTNYTWDSVGKKIMELVKL